MSKIIKACASAVVLLISSCAPKDSEVLNACEKLQETGDAVYLVSLGLDQVKAQQAITALNSDKRTGSYVSSCLQVVKNLLWRKFDVIGCVFLNNSAEFW